MYVLMNFFARLTVLMVSLNSSEFALDVVPKCKEC